MRCRYLRATLREPSHSQIWHRRTGVQQQGTYALYSLGHENPSRKPPVKAAGAVEVAAAVRQAFAGHAEITRLSTKLLGWLAFRR